ncbi:MAG TPA: autotransporter-associated beta strand repeat-containing protein [Candidatus Didemnitutus sp.]|nr:autotransporter-associated beta strand repeat-containing protein [Candidatus Didemnitutus sp.]
MKLRCIAAVLGGICALAGNLPAQIVWTGTVSGDITNPLNWSGIVLITDITNGDITFGNATTTTVVLDSSLLIGAFDLSTVAVHNISFSSATAAYTFNGTGSPTLFISGNVSTVANPNPVVVNNTIGVTLGGAGQQTFNIASGSAMNIAANINGSGATLVKAGAGTLTLGGTNSYTGGTVVNAGTLALTGSISHSSANFTVGNTSGDNGTVTLAAGATVSDQTLNVGLGTSSVGNITISGTGASWTNSTYIYAGAQGTGTININSGGGASSANTSIGNNTGGTGTINVDGTGSTLNNSSTLYVGSQGTGTLNITNGADVSDATGSIGNNAGGHGLVNISGAGSTWSNTTQLIVGDAAADGVLNISSGGVVGSATGTVGAIAGSIGNVFIDGTGSNWNNTSALGIGLAGAGSVTVANGASLSITSGARTITLGANSGSLGTLNIGAPAAGVAAAGGGINVSTITTGSGTGALQFKTNATAASPYYLTTTGNSSGITVTVTGATNVINTAGYNVMAASSSYTGGTNINGGSLMAGNSGALGTNTITINGGNLLLSGGITLNNAITLTNGMIGGGGTLTSPVSVGTNGTLAPGLNGFPIMTLTFGGGLTFAGAGQLKLDIQSAAGAAGVGYDNLASTAGLTITSTTASPFKISLTSLDLSGAPGNVSDFSSASSYAWVFASSPGITGFAANKFLIDSTGFTNALNGGVFTITQGTSGGVPALFLNFTPVPEPSTYALLAVGLGSVLLPVLRRRRRN